jgi:hypothetical protein
LDTALMLDRERARRDGQMMILVATGNSVKTSPLNFKADYSMVSVLSECYDPACAVDVRQLSQCQSWKLRRRSTIASIMVERNGLNFG